MVVAGSQVDIAAQAIVFAAHKHQQLGVGLVAEHPVHDVHADIFELCRPGDIGLFVEARHEFEHHGDFLALLRCAHELLHQHRVGPGAIDRHLDRQDLGVFGTCLEQVDDRFETLEGMMQQDVLFANGLEDIAALLENLGLAGDERRELEVGSVHPVRDLHQANQVHDARCAVEIAWAEVELVQQKVAHAYRTVVGNLESHPVAEMPLLQFALERGAQVLDLFLVDEQVRVTGDPKLIAAEHVHAAEQISDMRVQHRGEEYEAVFHAGDLSGQLDHARQGPWRLDDCRTRVAAEGIEPLEFHREVEALVEHARERMGGIKPDRCEHRHHVILEIGLDPGLLLGRPGAAANEDDTLARERRQDRVVQQRVLLADDLMHRLADLQEQLLRGQSVGRDTSASEADLLLDAAHPDLEEFVEIARYDAEESQPLEQRNGRIGGL